MKRKPLNYQVPHPQEHAFRFNKMAKLFFPHFHQHKELQCTFIEYGNGWLIAGEYSGRYAAGDVILINSRVPHVFKPDDLSQQQISFNLYFDFNTMGADFWQSTEMSTVKSMLEQNNSVIRLQDEKRKEAAAILTSFNVNISLGNIILFVRILQLFENTRGLEFISGNNYVSLLEHAEKERMGRVIQYTIDNHPDQITLHEIAGEAGLSVTSFCRYFKKHTSKTYVYFLNEIRIQHACRMLLDTNTKVEQIAYTCGFTQLSHFNKVFKQYKKMPPGTFRRQKKMK